MILKRGTGKNEDREEDRENGREERRVKRKTGGVLLNFN
jgi:hypothetical protein